MIKKFISILTISAFLTVLTFSAGCSNKSIEKTTSSANKHSDVKGLLWKVDNKKSTVYIYASFHLMKDDMLPFSKTIENAFDKSHNLVVECNISTSNMNEIEKNQDKMFYEEDGNVYNHLSSAGKDKINSLAKEVNLNMNDLKHARLWAIYSTFLDTQLNKSGFNNEGVDAYFLKKVKYGHNILELESIEKQYDIMNEISDSEQEKQYLTDVSSMKEEGEKNEKSYNAYVQGDEKTLTKLSVNAVKKYLETYKIEIKDRDLQMADKIGNYLNSNDTYFVVAGAAHCVGSDSIINILKKKGYKVERVR